MHYMLVVLVACMIANVATAHDDDGERIRIKGTSIGLFTQFNNLGLSQGRVVSDVGLDGTFEITVGDIIRTGRFSFPHLLVANLEFPPEGGPPTFLSGHVAGATVWFFDDGVVCDGPLSGDFDETGGNLLAKGKLDCTDGTRLKIDVQDVEVIPGVSVESKIRGKLFIPDEDD